MVKEKEDDFRNVSYDSSGPKSKSKESSEEEVFQTHPMSFSHQHSEEYGRNSQANSRKHSHKARHTSPPSCVLLSRCICPDHPPPTLNLPAVSTFYPSP